jgi:hypothetical protein
MDNKKGKGVLKNALPFNFIYPNNPVHAPSKEGAV